MANSIAARKVADSHFTKSGDTSSPRRFALRSRPTEHIKEQERVLPRIRVLLIGKHDASLAYPRAVFEALGLTVSTCTTPDAALARLGRETFGLVVVNQKGPDLEARPFLTRSKELHPRPPVVVVTRQFDVRAYDEAVLLGAAGYLPEPVTVREIVQVTKTCLKDESRRDPPF
jgi:DNA-binding NtrC family response regulator